MKERVIAEIMDCIESKQKTAEQLSEKIAAAAQMCIEAYRNGNKVLLCGNGGSAADAQHIAAELVARFYLERKALPAIALNTDTSIITALGNDYDFDYIYKRQVEAHGTKGDILFGISTSGNSPNIITACEYAKSIGMKTIGLSGKDGGKLDKTVDLSLVVPSAVTPRIQENHIMIGHIICNLIEQELFGDNNG